MPSIEDWAAKCSRRIKAEIEITKNPRNISEARIAAIIATFAEPILKLLEESRRDHVHSDGDVRDGACCSRCTCHSWDAVARAQDGGELDAEREPNSDEPCTCGADSWNKRVDDATR